MTPRIREGAPTPGTRIANAITSALVLAVTAWLVPVVTATLLWDAAWRPVRRSALFARLSGRTAPLRARLARRLLTDPRNEPYLVPLLVVGTVVPIALALSIAWQSRPALRWSLVFAYHVVLLGPYFRFFSEVATLIHHEAHTPAGWFRAPFSPLDRVYSWALGPLYGHVPESYRAGHVAIHHRHDNGPDDVTSTLALDRRRPGSWLVYMRRFVAYWSGASVLRYHLRRGHAKKARQMALGMAFFYGLCLAVTLWWPAFGFAYLILPHLMVIVLLGAINYTWHAFCDPDDPTNPYTNSLTIIDGTYNFYEEDFHAAHHLKPSLHWTEQDDHFQLGRERYDGEVATVLRGVQAFEVFILILSGRTRRLAEVFVDPTGTMTLEERERLVVRRLSPVR